MPPYLCRAGSCGRGVGEPHRAERLPPRGARRARPWTVTTAVTASAGPAVNTAPQDRHRSRPLHRNGRLTGTAVEDTDGRRRECSQTTSRYCHRNLTAPACNHAVHDIEPGRRAAAPARPDRREIATATATRPARWKEHGRVHLSWCTRRRAPAAVVRVAVYGCCGLMVPSIIRPRGGQRGHRGCRRRGDGCPDLWTRTVQRRRGHPPCRTAAGTSGATKSAALDSHEGLAGRIPDPNRNHGCHGRHGRHDSGHDGTRPPDHAGPDTANTRRKC
jgi:hypothetical protein